MKRSAKQVRGLPSSADAVEPTVAAIKSALHELSRTAAGSGRRDAVANLREAHQLLRALAIQNGIDPDGAVRQRLAEVEMLRRRMAQATAPATGLAAP